MTTGIPVQKKTFSAVLHSVSRSVLDDEVLNQDLKMQLFQNETHIGTDNQEEIINSLTKVFGEAAERNLQPAQLKDFLHERQDVSFNDEQLQIFVQFWTNEGPKHHAKKIKNASFNRSLVPNGLKWRVDQVTNVKNLSEISQTVAVVELVTKINNGSDRKISFEVGRDTLNQVLDQLNQVQKRIESLSI